MGRFTTRDPNETALPIIASMLVKGQSWLIIIDNLNVLTLYTNGMNIHQYVGSNPIRYVDPSGMNASAGALGRGNSAGVAVIGLLLVSMVAIQQQGVGFVLDGVDATLSGSVAAGENLILVGESIIDLLGHAVLGVAAKTQAEAVNKARTYWPTLAFHFNKLLTGGPGDWGSGPQNWLREIRDKLDIIEGLLKHMGKRKAKEWADWAKRFLEEAERVMKSGSGSPPPMPG